MKTKLQHKYKVTQFKSSLEQIQQLIHDLKTTYERWSEFNVCECETPSEPLQNFKNVC
jgi:hypothetical protein